MKTVSNGSADHAPGANRCAACRNLHHHHIMSLVLCLLALSPMLSAEVYTWTDEHGQVHFGDKPREGAEAVTTIQDSDANTTAALQGRQEKLRRLLQSYEIDRREKTQERTAQAEERREQALRCAEIRKELEYTASGVFYRDSDDPRNPEIIDQGEVDAYRAELRGAEKKFCGR